MKSSYVKKVAEYWGAGGEKIKKLEGEKQVEALVGLANKKGTKHAIKVAKALEDPYVLDRFHDEMGMMNGSKSVLLEVEFLKSTESDGDYMARLARIFDSIAKLDFKESLFEKIIGEHSYLAIEITVVEKKVRIFFSIPHNSREEFTNAVYSVYPGIGIKDAKDYTIFKKDENISIKRLALGRDALLSLDTTAGRGRANFITLLDGYWENESFALQIIFYPKSKKWHITQSRNIDASENGTEEEKINFGPKSEKLNAFCVSSNIRIVFNSSNKDRLKKFDKDLSQMFESLHSREPYNFLTVKAADNRQDVFDYIFRNFNNSEKILLNSKEIAWIIQLF